jgi:hypothetical protein
MSVVVHRPFVIGMGMVMRTMVTGVLMFVHHRIPIMVMFVLVLMQVLVRMGMGVLMSMRLASVRMLVDMDVGMFMSVNMFMFVIPVHANAPFVCNRLKE